MSTYSRTITYNRFWLNPKDDTTRPFIVLAHPIALAFLLFSLLSSPSATLAFNEPPPSTIQTHICYHHHESKQHRGPPARLLHVVPVLHLQRQHPRLDRVPAPHQHPGPSTWYNSLPRRSNRLLACVGLPVQRLLRHHNRASRRVALHVQGLEDQSASRKYHEM